jgi:hypothetical protein
LRIGGCYIVCYSLFCSYVSSSFCVIINFTNYEKWCWDTNLEIGFICSSSFYAFISTFCTIVNKWSTKK